MASPSHHAISDQLRQAGLTQETEGFARQFLHHQFALTQVVGNLQGAVLVRQLRLMRDHFGLDVDWLRTLANNLGVQQLVKHQNRYAPFTQQSLTCSTSTMVLAPLLNSPTASSSPMLSSTGLSGAGLHFPSGHVNIDPTCLYITSSGHLLQSIPPATPAAFALNATRAPTDMCNNMAVPPGVGASFDQNYNTIASDHTDRNRITSDTIDTFASQASVPTHPHTELRPHRPTILDALLARALHQTVPPTMTATLQGLRHDTSFEPPVQELGLQDGTMIDSIEDYSDLLDSADPMGMSTTNVAAITPTQTVAHNIANPAFIHISQPAGPTLLHHSLQHSLERDNLYNSHQFQSLGDRVTTHLQARLDADQYSTALQRVLQSSNILQPQHWHPDPSILGQPSFSTGTTTTMDDSSQHSWSSASSTPTLIRTENKAARRVANMSPERAVLMRRQSRDRYRRYKQQAHQHQEYQEQARLDVLQAQRQKLLEDKASLESELSALLAQIRDG
jgi:hypothetical protein